MKIVTACLSFMLFFHFNSFAQDSLQQRIILIGDAGQFYKGHHPVVDAVKKNMPLDSKTTIVYLGDNLYKVGLPDDQLPTYEIAKAVLDTQISIVEGTPARVFFIPGNHDWAGGGANGYESIRRQQRYVEIIGNTFKNENIQYLPRDGCPGPEEVNLTKDVVLVIVDSQWWLHEYTKPGIESDCPYKTKNEVLTQLRDILDRNYKKLVIIAMHHPFRSYGSHGSYYPIKQHIFPFTELNKNLYIPLPLIGSIYPIVRGMFGTTQDLKHPVYQEMIRDFETVLTGHPNVIMASGHEHSLQYIEDSSRTYIVSGSGSKAYRVSKPKISLYAKNGFGFATIEVSKAKNVTARMYTVDENTGETKMDFEHEVLNFSKLPAAIVEDTVRMVEAKFGDSVTISASDKYKNPSGLRKVFLGNNYRKAWSTPIHLKVFNIRKEKGGLIPEGIGGGKQTKSLTLRDPSGKLWILRSIDKDPEIEIPETLQGTLAQRIVQDLISGGEPYAPLVVSQLSKSTGILAPDPKVFFVPDDPAFGFYRKLFRNTVCIFEEKEPLMGNATDTRSTNKVISKMLEDQDHRVDQQSYLRARLLDMTIGDWERHAGQWRWDILDTGKGKLYYAVPRDRDQAFFNSDGLIMRYIRNAKLPYLQGFRKTIPYINWLNYTARDIDRFFLNGLEDKDWMNTLISFTNDLSDSVIENAVKKLPPEVYPIDGPVIERKLKSRRNILFDQALKYYRFISKKVNVVGTNEKEYFRVSQNGDSLLVKVFKRTRKSDTASLMYQRNFLSYVTREIRLYGLNGNDYFYVDSNVQSSIKLRIIGGRGNDTFNVNGDLRNRIYDLSTEKNTVLNGNRTRKRFSNEIGVNEYSPTGFSYDQQKFPKLLLGYNDEDKILVGVGFSRINYGFRKQPYGSQNTLSLLYALNRGAYKLKYSGIFNNVIGHTDFLVRSEIVNPVLDNFYGLGNSTVNNPDKSRTFYRVRYKYTQSELLMRKRLLDYLDVAIGGMYYHYWNNPKDNTNRILQNPRLVGLDSASIYSNKSYAGLKAGLYVDFVNDEIFPTRGIIWNTELQALSGLNKNSRAIVKAYTDMMIPIPIVGPTTLYTVLKAGGGHIFTNQYEYFQAFTLGANNYMRGYRKNRFTGSSLAYLNLDVRWKLFKSTSYILPGDVGLLGFYDLGRVWTKNMDDRTWHNSYGTGIYFTPFNLVVVAVTVGFSKESTLLNFSLGTKFNLTY